MISNVTYWLEEAADKYPEKTAFADAYKSITYAQLNNQAKAIASSLIDRGIFKKPVAVYMNKSVDAIAAFYGIAYSGNFYTCLDTEMPAYRIKKILEVLDPEIILTTKETADDVSAFEYSKDVLLFENEICYPVDEEKVSTAGRRIINTDLLFVVFTSGSTGVPKGVAVTHRAVINDVDWFNETFRMSDTDIMGNQTPFHYVLTLFDLYVTVSKGMTCHIIPKHLFTIPVSLLEYIKEKRINSIIWVPSALIMISHLNAFENVDLNNTLKKVFFAGEPMPSKQLNIWRRYLPDVQYVQIYGTSETTMVIYYIIEKDFADEEMIPLGIPIENADVLVLDDNDCLVDGDGAGELCIRGSVNEGYYNEPQKTREVFVQNPLNTAFPEVIYRTGDLVKYNNNGELIYVSRKDYQIKHMGHRIELGEIEAAAASIPEVGSCCCLYDKENSKIVLFIDVNIERSYIRKQLSYMIPKYMIPGKIVILETMPTNTNGKIDRVKLKEML